jgi:hypothetical protein
MGLRGVRVGATSVAVLGAAVLAASPVGAVTTPTTVASWAMDEPAGAATMHDSTGHGHHGTITGSVTTGVPGHTGSAYSFSGSSLVRVPHSPALNPGTAPITISAWLRVPATLGSGDYNVVQKGVATASGGAWKMEIHASSGKKFGYPACAFNGPTRAKNRVYGPVAVNDGRWHRVECRLTATSAYAVVDGVSGPVAKRVVPSIANTTDVTLGGKPTNKHYFVGDLDDVSVTIG